MQSPPFPRYLVSPRSKYSPQHHILKHPQLPFLPQCQRPSFTPIQNKWQNYSSMPCLNRMTKQKMNLPWIRTKWRRQAHWQYRITGCQLVLQSCCSMKHIWHFATRSNSLDFVSRNKRRSIIITWPTGTEKEWIYHMSTLCSNCRYYSIKMNAFQCLVRQGLFYQLRS